MRLGCGVYVCRRRAQDRAIRTLLLPHHRRWEELLVLLPRHRHPPRLVCVFGEPLLVGLVDYCACSGEKEGTTNTLGT